ncbi:2,3-diaminopropionate biosynthesis protein SbnB [Cohnella thailandensis]|uniref:2,3-diaminopropionate biosynthesis protein SbnB n=1 Tax=Cohnella thailandensis TaxID=557557 RepID=A0A841SQ62_9BACL|nr:2,3-diaminopropionate biosynthesis protein SbnB [Cohnella thailandensis]MBP1975316.1 ornithine cyclodeaminase [Cohnella thailandensis]
MIYLNDSHIDRIGSPWRELMRIVSAALKHQGTEELVQPLKPYLRFRDLRNRIIAMPAFVGGEVEASGIKWIASFPGNLERGLPRAHNTLILNDTSTGAPVAFLRSSRLSAIRTAAVSGVMLDAYLNRKREPAPRFRVGIVGMGPIGLTHLQMLHSVYGDRLEEIRAFDVRGVSLETLPAELRGQVRICPDWREVYDRSDVFLTCTTSPERYIDRPARPGTLLLNVSLRDYAPDSVKLLRAIVVDDWREVCRENTDIEKLHLLHGLAEKDVLTLKQVVWEKGLEAYPPEEAVFFNPMGMAAFDIALAAYYLRQAERTGIGTRLE